MLIDELIDFSFNKEKFIQGLENMFCRVFGQSMASAEVNDRTDASNVKLGLTSNIVEPKNVWTT
jgi:hypothetical protein